MGVETKERSKRSEQGIDTEDNLNASQIKWYVSLRYNWDVDSKAVAIIIANEFALAYKARDEAFRILATPESDAELSKKHLSALLRK